MQEQALLMNNVQPAPENRMVKKAGTDSHARFRLPSESSVTAPISVSRYSWATARGCALASSYARQAVLTR